LIGIVIAGAGTLILLGGAAIEDDQQQIRLSQAETSFGLMDSRISQVAMGYSEGQTIQTELDPGTPGIDMKTRDTGWVNVSYLNLTTGDRTTILNETLGAVVYRNDETVVGYQGGGVWRHSSNGSNMVSPPELHYRNGTLTFPLVTVDGDEQLGGTLTVDREGQRVQEFPNASRGSDFLNPLEEKKVQIRIHSEFYKGWGAYFRTRTDAGVELDHANETAIITLLDPPEARRVLYAITSAGGSGGGGGQFQIQSGSNSVVDAYNSSDISATLGPSPPPSTPGDSDVVTDKIVEYSGNAEITGNLTTSRKVTSWGGSHNKVSGHLQTGTANVSEPNCIKYVVEWCNDNASVSFPDPVDAEVKNVINTLSDSSKNNNADESCFGKTTAVDFTGPGCSSTVELGAGDYYTDQDLQVQSGEKLLLNTTKGDIRIAVDGDKNIQFQSTGNVTVLGNGTVRIYGTKQYQIQSGNTMVWNRGWDAPQLWLFCDSSCQIQIQSGATFVGVVYAPSGPSVSSGAQIQIDGGNTEVYGAIVGGGQTQLKSQADIHFDQSLENRRVFEEPIIPPISYLHVTRHTLNVTG